MIISLIAAVDKNGCIGYKGEIPWHLRADLRRFKAITMGHHILMGRKTFESIGRLLPGRDTIILTRSSDSHFEGAIVKHSLERGVESARERGEKELFIIGGGEVFSQAISIADRIYLTRVHASGDCDTYFPELDTGEWLEYEKEELDADSENQYATSFFILDRISRYKKDESLEGMDLI